MFVGVDAADTVGDTATASPITRTTKAIMAKPFKFLFAFSLI